MRRRLQFVGSPVLRKKAGEVDLQRDGQLLSELIEEMWRILREKEGLGLAAPQAGEAGYSRNVSPITAPTRATPATNRKTTW